MLLGMLCELEEGYGLVWLDPTDPEELPGGPLVAFSGGFRMLIKHLRINEKCLFLEIQKFLDWRMPLGHPSGGSSGLAGMKGQSCPIYVGGWIRAKRPG